eukprot:TRINITY_DN52387_c0_g1_i1.p1 TRINITY_DN52387_c0_g1~~TRINITY_DN52387_c0_g1_i1.p1  ORF type:complete len:364 (+),score=75.69 TRINITY_DN52387_c0_g1_i1:111-1202(+)
MPTAVPAMRALGQVAQPVAILPSIVRAATPWLTAFPVPQQMPAVQNGLPQPSSSTLLSEPCCAALRQHPWLLQQLLEKSDSANGTEDLQSESAVPSPDSLLTAAGDKVDAVDAEVSKPLMASPESTRQSSIPEEVEPPRQSSASLAATTMLVQDYELRMRKLEQRCRELSGENLQLQSELVKTQTQREQGRDLNFRLGRETQEARRQCAEAEAHVQRLKEELDQLRSKSSSPVESGSIARIAIEPPPGLPIAAVNDSLVDSVGTGSKSRAGELDIKCSSCLEGWGCEAHQAYSGRLLLAHRDKSLLVASGPPGLERLGNPAEDLEATGRLLVRDVPSTIARRRVHRLRNPVRQRAQRAKPNKA